MSKYDELRMAVSSLVYAEDVYWQKLYDVYHDFQEKFREYLGLTTETVIDSSSQKQAVLITGLYNQSSNKVVPTSPSSLPKEGRKLYFHFLLNLCSSETEDIQLQELCDVTVRRNGDEYYFDSESIPSEVKCFEIDGCVDVNPFFDEIYSKLMSKLNVKK